MGAERRRRTVTVEDVTGQAAAGRRGGPAAEGSGRRTTPAPRDAATARARAVVIAMVAAMAVLLAATGFAAVQIAGRAGSVVEAMLPPQTIVITPGVIAQATAPPPTTAPRPELVALRGRPASPVGGDESVCAGPLQAGKLRPQVVSQWSGRSAPASSGEIADADARAEIALIMRRRFRRDEPERAVREAIQLYESPRVREVAGEQITVRAALAELKGTLGEPALRFLLTTDRPILITFGVPSDDAAAAEAYSYGEDIDITVREEYRFEPPAVLAPILFHELLHQNGQSQQPEEVVSNVLDARVLLEMMRDAPGAFTRRTRATDGERTKAVMQLNTRVGRVLAVDRSDAPSVLPGYEGPPVPSIGAAMRTGVGSEDGYSPYAKLADAPSEGHQTLTEILRMVAPDAVVPDKAFFDQAAVALLDANAGVGLCDQLVAAEAIGVVPKGSPGQRFAREYLNMLTK